MLQLIVEQGQPAGQAWSLNPGLTSVGRSANNDIILSGNQVSRVHFVIEMVGPDQYVLSDKSTNGTMVNGRRAQDRTPLKAGDRIQVGDVVLRCDAGAADAPAWPVEGPGPAAASWPAPMQEPAAWPMPVASPMPAPAPRPTSNLIPIAIGVIAAILILTAVIAAPLFISGRRPTNSVTATPTVTAVVAAPGTATVEPTAILTLTAVVTPTLAPAPVTISGRVKAGQGLNVRAAPETAAQRLYTLGQQAAITAIGRNDAGDWLLIQCQSGQPPDQKCWIFASLVNLDQPANHLPIVQP